MTTLRDLLSAATPREWLHMSDGKRTEIWGAAGTGAHGFRKTVMRTTTRADAALIVALVNTAEAREDIIDAARTLLLSIDGPANEAYVGASGYAAYLRGFAADLRAALARLDALTKQEQE